MSVIKKQFSITREAPRKQMPTNNGQTLWPPEVAAGRRSAIPMGEDFKQFQLVPGALSVKSLAPLVCHLTGS